MDHPSNMGMGMMSGSGDQSGEQHEFPLKANLDSLSVNGETPAVGDEVELTVKGTVSDVHDGIACIKPVEVNGEPAPSETDTADTAESLRGKAVAADNASY